MESIFELETGVGYLHNNHIITCHRCNTTFSPVKVMIIPTSLCAHYSGTYKRMCIIYYISDNICEHLTFDGKWGSIFIGDIEALPLTILSKFDDIIKEQPDQEIAKKAWNHAIDIYNERNK